MFKKEINLNYIHFKGGDFVVVAGDSNSTNAERGRHTSKILFNLSSLSTEANSFLFISDNHIPPGSYFFVVAYPLSPSVDPRLPPSCLATRGSDNIEQKGPAHLFQVESDGSCHRISGSSSTHDSSHNTLSVLDTKLKLSFGLAFNYSGGDTCNTIGGKHFPRSGTILLECYNGRAPHGFVREVSACNYELTYRHPAACPLECPRIPQFGSVCGGVRRGRCNRGGHDDPFPRCLCKSGFSGIACEVAEKSFVKQPSLEPSPLLSHVPILLKQLPNSPSRLGLLAELPTFFQVFFFILFLLIAFTLFGCRPSDSYFFRARRFRSGMFFVFVFAVWLFRVFFYASAPKIIRARSTHLFQYNDAVSSILSFPSFASRKVSLPFSARKRQRVFIRAFDLENGGPHSLAQLAGTLADSLHMKRIHTTRSVPRFDSRYTRNVSVGEGSARGDIVIDHEYHTSAVDVSSGIKQFIWELGDLPPQDFHRASKFLGHTFYTRSFVRQPRLNLLRIYVDFSKWERVPSKVEDVRHLKKNIVLVDDEGPRGISGLLERRLSGRWPGLEVVEVKGFSKAELADLLRRAKVYVDAGMRGMEMMGQEVLPFFVVPILEHARNGETEFDYPLPESLKFDYSRHEATGAIQNGGDDVVAKVEAVLGDWEGALERIEPARRLFFYRKQLAAIDPARLFSATLNVHVLACSPFHIGGVDSVVEDALSLQALSAYFVASAVHFVAPAASTTLHAPLDEQDFKADVSQFLLAAADMLGTLSFTRVSGSSPLCEHANSKSLSDAQRSAMVYSHFGNADLVAVLSWRALPLQPRSITSWQDALRASSALYSTLVLRGAVLGVLFKVEDGETSDPRQPPPFSAYLNQEGALYLSWKDPSSASEPLVWSDNGSPSSSNRDHGAAEQGLWLDLRRLARFGVPRLFGVDADPPVLDQALALLEAGIDVENPTREALRDHAAVLRLYRLADRNGAAYLCGHTDFRRLAGFTPYATDLCGGDAVVTHV